MQSSRAVSIGLLGLAVILVVAVDIFYFVHLRGSEEVVKTWQKAGAIPGSIRFDEASGVPLFFESLNVPAEGQIRGFRLFWSEGVLAKLPPPQEPFGLRLKNITDEGLKELARFKHLQVLILSGSTVTNAGLKELAGIEDLQALVLSGSAVNDNGLKELANLHKLETLKLNVPGMTDAGLKELSNLSGLRNLSLQQTHTSDAGLKHLAGLTNLRKLNLLYTKITDEGLRELTFSSNWNRSTSGSRRSPRLASSTWPFCPN